MKILLRSVHNVHLATGRTLVGASRSRSLGAFPGGEIFQLAQGSRGAHPLYQLRVSDEIDVILAGYLVKEFV